MSLNYMLKRYEEDNPVREIAEDVLDEAISEQVEQTTEIVEDLQEIMDECDKAEVIDEGIGLIDAVHEMATEGLTPAGFRFCQRIGLTDLMSHHGMEVPGVESFSSAAGSKAASQMIAAGCEAAEKTWFSRIKSFFQKIGSMLKNMVVRIADMFRSQKNRCEKAYALIKDMKSSDIDPDKAKDYKVKQRLFEADTATAATFVQQIIDAIDTVAKASASAVKDKTIDQLKTEIAFGELQNTKDRLLSTGMVTSSLKTGLLADVQKNFTSSLPTLLNAKEAVKTTLAGVEAAKRKFDSAASQALSTEPKVKATAKEQAEYARACASIISQMNGWAIKIATVGINDWYRYAQAFISVKKQAI